MSILFTTGATVTFKSLLDEVASPEFLDFLQKSGFEKVSIQYGNEIDPKTDANISKKYFSEILAKGKVVEHFDFEIANETNDKSVTVFQSPGFSLEVFGFSDDINAHIRTADLVVSHAGTGSILDTLRLNKPLIVVTNESLMDSHQEEIASRFEAEKYLAKVGESELVKGMLKQKIQQWKEGKLKFNSLPEPPSNIIAHVVSQEVGEL